MYEEIKKISDCRLQTKSMGRDYKGNRAWSICSLQWSVSFNEILTWNCFCIIHPSDYQRPSLPNSNCPPTPLLPLSFSSLSMLFCMVTFGFKKIKRGGERVKEDCHGRCPGEVSQPIISGNVGLWKKLWQFETALATIVVHFCSCVCVPTTVYSFVRLTQH